MNLADHFDNPEEAIAAAERNANTAWEVAFVGSFRERFDRNGAATCCSIEAAEQLRKIAGDPDDDR